jgi:hypothetical protein
VKPKTAEVYVDGRYVGVAGNFDGNPGYLWIPTGTHRVELIQDGYVNLERQFDIATGQVTEFKLQMEHGVTDRPPAHDYSQPAPSSRAPYPESGGHAAPEGGQPPGASGAGADHRGTAPARERRRDASIMFQVEPDDASVYLDGRFVGTGRDVSTATEPLPVFPGDHRVQVVHPDYPNQEQSVTINSGEQKLVEITLHHGSGV